MKIKVVLLVSVMMGMFHMTFSDSSLRAHLAVFCYKCGWPLLTQEIQENVKAGKSKNSFVCGKCKGLKGFTEDKGLAGGEVSSEKGSGSLGGESEAQVSDHFYENRQVRQLIDEALWTLSAKDVKRPQKVKAGGGRKKIFLRKRPSRKKQTTGNNLLPETPEVPTISSFFQNMWLYTFPPSALGPYCHLQVVHGDKSFTSFSHSPARELWCRGPRSIVVTDDGYTYFDIEKQQRVFFKNKEDLIAHAVQVGFDSELNVVLAEDSQSDGSVPRQDSAYDRIIAEYRRNVEQIMEHHRGETQKIDDEHAAKMKEITDSFARIQAS
jgi:hypothetical protein